MSYSKYCDVCHRWFYITYSSHMEAHRRANPHVFCRTLRCDNGDDCPVKP